MLPDLAKVLRTGQSMFPMLKPAKDALYHHGRRILRIPHESSLELVRRFTGPDDLFLDVGANHGQTIASIRLFRPDARIVSFEANPNLGKRLQARYASDENVTVHALGLSDRPGEFTLHVPKYNNFVYDGLASLDRGQAAGWLNEQTIYGFDPAKLTIEEMRCSVATLDSFDIAPTFIKIDVQGFEYEVLRGGLRTLERMEPVIFLEEAFEGDPRIEGLLSPHGYREYHVENGWLKPGRGASCKSFLVTQRRIRTLMQ